MMQLWIVWRLEYIRGEISLIMMFHFLRKGNYMEQATIAGRWKPRLLCGSHTRCLQAESMLAWLAACCHRALESSGDRRLRADSGSDRRFRYYLCA